VYCASYSQATTAGIAVLTFVCLCDFLSLPRNYRRKVPTEWVQSTYTTSAWTFLACWDVSVHFCSGFFLSHIFFLRLFFVREVFFPWVHWPCTLNKFWCHWLSFHLAHPNPLFAIYLVLSIRPVVYVILWHLIACLYSILLLYCIGTSHSYFASALLLPGPSLWLVSCCLHAVPQMRVTQI